MNNIADPDRRRVANSIWAHVIAFRVALLVVFHAAVFTAVYLLSHLLRFEFAVPAAAHMWQSLPFIVAVQMLVGSAFGFYRGWWRYVGTGEVLRLVSGLTVALMAFILAWYGTGAFGINAAVFQPPRGVLLIDWSFAILTLFGARVAMRVGRDRIDGDRRTETNRRVLIVGAGDAGEALARDLEHRPHLAMKVVGFVDDHRAKQGASIRGVKVEGPIASIASIAGRLKADEALIAIPSATGRRMREIVRVLAAANLPFKTMPGIDQLVNGRVQVSQLRPVNAEDLLRRERVDLAGDPVRHTFAGKRVLITGAGGTIGSELASQILQFEPAALVLLERSEYALYEVRRRLSREAPHTKIRISNALIGIQQTGAVKSLLQTHRPDIVIHAAAHKHVPLGEENPAEYVRNNTLATRALADSCTESGVQRFVLISTDKAIRPMSVMGASKRAAEIVVLDRAARSNMRTVCVRFGNVIGSSGSVIPLFMDQIAAGGPVTVTDPQVTRYFLRTSEAVSLVLQAVTLGNRGEIFMLDMGEPVKIVDLARDLIRLSNQTEEDIPIVFTGLRPGEKLYEELRIHDESMRPTSHPQIVVTEAPQPDSARILECLARLEVACERNPAAVVHVLRELVPEFTPAAEHGMFDAGTFLDVGSVPVAAERPTSH